MSLDILSKDILLKAESKKKTFELELKEEILSLEREHENLISSFKNTLISKNQKEITFQKNKILGFYKRESKRLVLDTKSKIIEDVYNKSLESLNNLKGEQIKDIYSSLIDYAMLNISFSKIYCGKKNITILKELVSSKDIQISQKENLLGLIFEGKNGKEIFDLSLKNLLDISFEENEEKIQNILFSKI